MCERERAVTVTVVKSLLITLCCLLVLLVTSFLIPRRLFNNIAVCLEVDTCSVWYTFSPFFGPALGED